MHITWMELAVQIAQIAVPIVTVAFVCLILAQFKEIKRSNYLRERPLIILDPDRGDVIITDGKVQAMPFINTGKMAAYNLKTIHCAGISEIAWDDSENNDCDENPQGDVPPGERIKLYLEINDRHLVSDKVEFGIRLEYDRTEKPGEKTGTYMAKIRFVRRKGSDTDYKLEDIYETKIS